MVNALLTVTVKVNIPLVPIFFAREDRGSTMKKRPARGGFWSWLFGSGWSNGGSGG
jgi:hypothetical protein